MIFNVNTDINEINAVGALTRAGNIRNGEFLDLADARPGDPKSHPAEPRPVIPLLLLDD